MKSLYYSLLSSMLFLGILNSGFAAPGTYKCYFYEQTAKIDSFFVDRNKATQGPIRITIDDINNPQNTLVAQQVKAILHPSLLGVSYKTEYLNSASTPPQHIEFFTKWRHDKGPFSSNVYYGEYLRCNQTK